eukprot:1159058-Pelagomonas_calceolata.AAC.2
MGCIAEVDREQLSFASHIHPGCVACALALPSFMCLRLLRVSTVHRGLAMLLGLGGLCFLLTSLVGRGGQSAQQKLRKIIDA